jgi:hypothetical protein
MKKPEVTKYYVARDKNGGVFLFNNKPIKSKERGFWTVDGKLSDHNLMLRIAGALSLIEHGEVVPHWEDDEPMEVALALVPYDSVRVELVTEVKILTR